MDAAERGTILVVEDREELRGLFAVTLQELGYRVWQARDGEAALAIIAAEWGRIDLVISDIFMPHMNGLELHERLTSLGARTKVLLMSGYAEAVVSRYGGLPRSMTLIGKPFSLSELATKVRALLDGP